MKWPQVWVMGSHTCAYFSDWSELWLDINGQYVIAGTVTATKTDSM